MSEGGRVRDPERARRQGAEKLPMDIGLAGTSEGDDGDFRVQFGEPAAELEPAMERPASERKVLGTAGTDMDAEPWRPGNPLFAIPVGRPLGLGIREGDFEEGFPEAPLEAKQGEEAEIVLGAGDGVVLRNRVGDEPSVEQDSFSYWWERRRRARMIRETIRYSRRPWGWSVRDRS